jgi:hypothetical protein
MPWTRVLILRRGVGSIVPCSFQLSITAGVNKKPKNLFSAYYDFFHSVMKEKYQTVQKTPICMYNCVALLFIIYYFFVTTHKF